MQWHVICERQAGAVSRQQLLAAGASRDSVRHLIRGGRLVSTRWPGVYRAAGAPLTPEFVQWGSVLDAQAVLSYLSAAAWWEFPIRSDHRVHVTAPERRRTGMPLGIRVHRVQLDPSAVTERFGMPITTPSETLLDCLGWLPLGESTTLADRAFQQKWLTSSDLARRLDEQPGRWGNKRLAYLLKQSALGAHAESERRLLRLLQEAGIDGWQANWPIDVGGAQFVLDVAFPERRVAIEVDGWAFHSDVSRFRQDRRRGNALISAGWTVLRFTWADITESPDRLIATIQAVLAA